MKVLTGLIITCLALNVNGLPSSQIVGGNDAPDGLYPYQVSLRYNNQHLCGGAIITNRNILTTAQCVTSFDALDLSAAVGSNYLDKPGTIYQVIKIHIHAGYNKLSRSHNIALLYVSENMIFDKNVKPIALPNIDRNYDNYPLVATGWGRLKAWDPPSNRLQEIIVKGYSQENCKRLYNQYTINESHICTYTRYAEGTCDGDSGGPLVTDGVLVGLISYGSTLCATGDADVHVRVFYYRKWINNYII